MAETREKQEESLAEGTLMSHLLELRDRLMKAVLALFVVFIPCAIYANELFTLVAEPLVNKLPAGSSLQSTSVVGPFMTPFKVSFFSSGGLCGTTMSAPASGEGFDHRPFFGFTFPFGWTIFTRPLSDPSVYPPA